MGMPIGKLVNIYLSQFFTVFNYVINMFYSFFLKKNTSMLKLTYFNHIFFFILNFLKQQKVDNGLFA